MEINFCFAGCMQERDCRSQWLSHHAWLFIDDYVPHHPGERERERERDFKGPVIYSEGHKHVKLDSTNVLLDRIQLLWGLFISEE